MPFPNARSKIIISGGNFWGDKKTIYRGIRWSLSAPYYSSTVWAPSQLLEEEKKPKKREREASKCTCHSSRENTPFAITYLNYLLRGFEKGLADRGGWQGNPSHTIDSGRFSAPVSYPHLWVGEHTSGGQFLLFFGCCWSPTPSRQPLFETSENNPKN